MIIDHDDICMPERLNIHKNQLSNNNNNAKLFFGNTIHFSNNDKNEIYHFDKFDLSKINTNKYHIYESLISLGCFIDSESVMFNKKAAENISNFNTNYKYLADYDFFLKMGKKYNFSFTKKVLSKWRIHENQASKIMNLIEKKEYIKLYFYNLLNINLQINIRVILLIRLFKTIISVSGVNKIEENTNKIRNITRDRHKTKIV